jgi:hypothetical protein
MPAAPIVDAASDVSYKTMFKLAKLIDFPDFVKNAEADDPTTVKALPPTVFADAINRKFPCHTKAATWLSQLYFLNARPQYPTRRASEVQDRISKAAAFFAISESVDKARAGWDGHQKTAQTIAPKDHAIVINNQQNPTYALPINNPENIKAAAQEIVGNRSNYPFDIRHLASRRILHAAREHQVQLPEQADEYLHKAAGFGTTLPARAAEKLALRTIMMPKGASQERLLGAKLASAVAKMKEIPNEELVKLAHLVDRIDAEFNIHRHYDEGVEAPEEIFFELTSRKAASVRNDYIQLTTGTIIPREAVEKLPIDKIAATLGADFLKAITADGSLDIDCEKFARVAATLPRGDAMLLERAIEAAGEIQTPQFEQLVED